MTDVELPALVKQRFLHIFLQDKGPQRAIAVFLPSLQSQPNVL